MKLTGGGWWFGVGWGGFGGALFCARSGRAATRRGRLGLGGSVRRETLRCADDAQDPQGRGFDTCLGQCHSPTRSWRLRAALAHGVVGLEFVMRSIECRWQTSGFGIFCLKPITVSQCMGCRVWTSRMHLSSQRAGQHRKCLSVSRHRDSACGLMPSSRALSLVHHSLYSSYHICHQPNSQANLPGAISAGTNKVWDQ